MLVRLPNNRRALIAGQKSGMVHAVDPDREGAILWQTRVGKGGTLGGVQWGTAYDGSRVYVAVSNVQAEPAPPGAPGAPPSLFGAPVRLNANAIASGHELLLVEQRRPVDHERLAPSRPSLRISLSELCVGRPARGGARTARPAAAEWGPRGPRGAAAWGSGRSPVYR
jgi:hypothetical protein